MGASDTLKAYLQPAGVKGQKVAESYLYYMAKECKFWEAIRPAQPFLCKVCANLRVCALKTHLLRKSPQVARFFKVWLTSTRDWII